VDQHKRWMRVVDEAMSNEDIDEARALLLTASVSGYSWLYKPLFVCNAGICARKGASGPAVLML
jgi:hypothetical protein